MAIAMIIATTPTARYIIRSDVVAKFVCVICVGSDVGAASITLNAVVADDGQ